MPSHEDPRKVAKPNLRRVTDKPAKKETKPKRPAPQTQRKPIYTDWAMF